MKILQEVFWGIIEDLLLRQPERFYILSYMRILLGKDLPLQSVSPSYVKVLYCSLAITALFVVLVPWIGAAVVWALTDSLIWASVCGAVGVIGLVSVLISARIAVRRVQMIGYAELEEELAIRTGIMFQKLVLVPYGRLQQVNVKTGPLLSHWELAEVEFVTASADTNACIPGLPLREAESLRERLTSRGQAHMEGL